MVEVYGVRTKVEHLGPITPLSFGASCRAPTKLSASSLFPSLVPLPFGLYFLPVYCYEVL